LGMLINTLPVRVRIEPETPLADWLARVQAAQAEAREYEHLPLVDVHGCSAVPRDQPLFESLLVFENAPADDSVGGTLAVEVITGVSEPSGYPLTWIIGPFEELLIMVFYDRTRIADDAVARVLADWQALLQDVVARPGVRTGEIPALVEADRRVQASLARSRARDQAEEFRF
jgi:non-ribosomal peptide synthetase component F